MHACIKKNIHINICMARYRMNSLSIYIRIFIHAYMHTFRMIMHALNFEAPSAIWNIYYTHIHTYMNMCIHNNIHTYMHTCIHAYMHTCIPSA